MFASTLIIFQGLNRPGITADLSSPEEWRYLSSQAYAIQRPLETVQGTPASVSRFRLLLPPKTALIIKYNPQSRTVADTLVPDYGLTGNALLAIEKSPSWLKLDLTDNLSQLDASRQNTLADMILNPREPRLRDEIAFEAAHISASHLKVINLDVIRQNVDSLYAIDNELEYADIVDYGNPDKDTNYYSTIRYKVLKDGINLDCEIPKEIYYWYVIHPRGTDENPAIIYNKFWREYLYYDNGTKSYTESGSYPLLKDALDTIEFAWEIKPQSVGGGAVSAVYDWVNGVVKWGATSPRPIQPIEIACDHDGNCGEFQDITWAAGRTALIPTVGVLDINEDHVWCTMWMSKSYDLPEESEWRPDSSGAFDKDHGGSKYCSLIWNWRGDGYQYSVIEQYSKSCTLTVKALGTNGKPLSNMNVNVNSQGWQTNEVLNGYSGITNREGVFVTAVGEEQDYYIKVLWNNLGKVVDSLSSLAGSNFNISCTLNTDYIPKSRDLSGINMYSHFAITGEMDTTIDMPEDKNAYLVFLNNYPEMSEALSGTISITEKGVRLLLDAEYDLGHCPTNSYEATNSRSTVLFSPGRLTDFFVTDWNGVHSLGLSEEAARNPEPLALSVQTLNLSRCVRFSLNGAESLVMLNVYDEAGRMVYSAKASPDSRGIAVIEWSILSQPSGVYFARAKSGKFLSTSKFVLVR